MPEACTNLFHKVIHRLVNSTAELELVAVALPVPLARSFDYRVPENLRASLQAGVRVRVPFGARQLIGLVLSAPRGALPAGHNYKLVTAVLDAAPIAPRDWLDFLQWAAAYYLHPTGEVISAAMPLALRMGKAAVFTPALVLQITSAGRAALATLPSRASRQRALLERLCLGPLPRGSGGFAAANIRHTLDQGWAIWAAATGPLLPEASLPPSLTAGQQAALAALIPAKPGFRVAVLQGITGSGKTELYLALAAKAVAEGRQVLVLVPEIGLTPQLTARFTERLGAAVVAYHSGMSETARLAAWLAIREGQASVLVGTRSAVFAPFACLGLVVVDEEHDVSFKQQDGFRYHARDLAVVRAQQAGAAMVLGSATPCLETLANARLGRYALVELKERVHTAASILPQLIDLNLYPARHGLSAPLAAAVSRHVTAGGQALLFINRRGYAPTLFCERCHWLAPCPNCDARLTVHRSEGRLICHHCAYSAPPPRQCPSCSASKLIALGEGTERLEEALKNLLPGRRIERFDSERFSTAKQLHALLDEVRARRVDVLVGTQMLAKGHDFGGISLVGVINADQALFSADFRATERFAQLLTQVSGRAGRSAASALPAEVMIQTREPRHPALLTLLAKGYGALATQLLAERRSAGLPPYAHLALLRAEAATAAEAMQFLQAAAQLLPADTGLEVLGPVPAVMERRAQRYRAQLLIRATQRRSLKAALGGWLESVHALPQSRRVRYGLDVDPVDLY